MKKITIFIMLAMFAMVATAQLKTTETFAVKALTNEVKSLFADEKMSDSFEIVFLSEMVTVPHSYGAKTANTVRFNMGEIFLGTFHKKDISFEGHFPKGEYLCRFDGKDDNNISLFASGRNVQDVVFLLISATSEFEWWHTKNLRSLSQILAEAAVYQLLSGKKLSFRIGPNGLSMYENSESAIWYLSDDH